MDKFISRTQMQTILDSRPKGVSMDTVIQGYRSNGYKVEGIDETPEAPQTLGQQAKDIATGFAKSAGRTALDVGQNIQTIGQGTLVAGANALGLPLDSIAKTGVQSLDANSPQGKVLEQSLQPTNDMQKYGGYGETALEFGAGGVTKDLAVGGSKLLVKGVKPVVNTVGDVIKSGANAVVDNSVVNGISTVAKSALESAKRIPDRMVTNVADKQATELAIKSLPTKTAQNAVRDGVNITDVKDISNIQRTPQVNKLIDTVKRFASGDKTVDPIEVVGQPIVQRIKTLAKEGEVIGKKLGEASKTIGVLTKPELENGVILRLQKVPGLSNIKVKNGVLNFKGTTLESSLSEADRTALQEAFTEATRWGDGEKAHMFRQTLFETLGGKKKSLTNITDTQERGYEAIRAGLSDVIETKSPSYKTLSDEYRKIVQPLGDMRKLMKNIDPNSSEDILNMSAGLLARRITSAASSNPQIKQILQALDKAGTRGTTKESVTQLQDMYNILNKYYDIAPKTGFQNLVKEGIGSSDSVVGLTKETLKNVAGQSNAVRQKALEKLLDELGVVLK